VKSIIKVQHEHFTDIDRMRIKVRRVANKNTEKVKSTL
jgi:hypothetical protein